MLIRSKLAGMSFRQIWVLTKVLIKKPLFIIPTYKATKKTIAICNIHFGKDHHKDTRANAFRHALWNFLICEKCSEVSRSIDAVVYWSEKVTNLHELISPNREIARKMDLHNNFIGRNLFLSNPETDAVKELEDMLQDAIKVGSAKEIENAGNKLVFIEDRNFKNERKILQIYRGTSGQDHFQAGGNRRESEIS
ncbi:DUF6973 domain-containing protein [Gramella sp. KN1008]|uniref:DUF6973 domain-containing protein n=1 Tax=Gramella sp. KN1008 TaxID=2529298 RepID=UPI00103F3DC5|nr:hypothetical protein [Gramella sp. KN1008]TBW27801.1 hypothetical protein EZJ28_08645 [Gramella sp. KN1008]